MFVIDVADAVKALIEKAKKATDANDALKFSQAACNVANARAALLIKMPKPDEENTG